MCYSSRWASADTYASWYNIIFVGRCTTTRVWMQLHSVMEGQWRIAPWVLYGKGGHVHVKKVGKPWPKSLLMGRDPVFWIFLWYWLASLDGSHISNFWITKSTLAKMGINQKCWYSLLGQILKKVCLKAIFTLLSKT